MKDIKLLIEKIKINREIEFEKDVKLLLDMKKYNDALNHSNKNDKENYMNSKNFNNSIGYVEKIYNEIKKKTIFEHSYYNNLINNYNKSSYYNTIMNYNTVSDKNENLINFFHMYLIRKYCEKNYYICLHNRFIRSITYSYLEKKNFLKYIDSDLYFLYSYIKTFSYILLKNENLNMYLIKLCSEIMSIIYEKLNLLRTKATYKNVQLYDEENYIPHNNLIKYIYFVVEFLCKNENYNYLNILYGVYSCIYVFSNVYYTCALSFNNLKAENYIKKKKDENKNYDEDNFILYYKYINEYSNCDFMRLNEMLLYFISKEKLKNNCNFNDILKDFNIVKYTTILQRMFFMEIFSKNNNDLIYNEKFKFIRINIFKKIYSIFDRCPLYLELPLEDKNLCDKYINEKEKKFYINNNSNKMQNVINDLKQNSEDENKSCLDNKEVHHYFFEEAKFNIDDMFFKKYLNNTIKENINNNENIGTICKSITDNNINKNIDNSTNNWHSEKEYFLKMFNDNYLEKKHYLECINEFCFIGIDFDKTITKKDSYFFFFKLLKKYYNYKNTEVKLTQDDISFFDNFSVEQMKNKKEFSPEERMDYLCKISQWIVLKEKNFLKQLEEKNNISDAFSDSYYYFLKIINDSIVKESLLLSYYDIFKDVNIDIINKTINESYEELELNDYFMETFLNLISFKQKNPQDFYFDIITLNFKKELCSFLLKNTLIKLDKLNFNQKLNSINNTYTEEEYYKKKNDKNLSSQFNNNDENKTNDYYNSFKKYFNIYYCKSYIYDKKKRKYTGEYKNNQLKIKYNKYSNENKIEKVSLNSVFDKTLIKNKVCSLLKNKDHKLSCFIGDSLFDIDIMLNVDIPILLGNNNIFIKFCEKHNILIKPLVLAGAKIEFLKLKNKHNENVNMKEGFMSIRKEREKQINEIYDENNKIIYYAESWMEICIFLFGNI
ncbi:conserved Plasmodium protein, unknown function [Plasmodium gallinaceum]|uniref:Uncharacterized protein n=1 Tax=Plasmodium gallinaceum TaxID=5849 RepID=A0A1J1GWP3_PLAGA|nr:conserved Plasmodium protein, unknown function [Plasmodium gallinaceum]CRG95725.1 conserved Plasmodium protein, unknown function [Plasmodium gallinaceum]